MFLLLFFLKVVLGVIDTPARFYFSSKFYSMLSSPRSRHMVAVICLLAEYLDFASGKKAIGHINITGNFILRP